MSGNATLTAAQQVRKVLLEKAGEILGLNPDRLDLVDREVVDREGTGKTLSLPDVVKACASEGLPLYNVSLFKAPFRTISQFKQIEGQVFPDFTYGTHAIEIAVDEEKGKISVLKLIACYDVGRAINRLSVEGQLEGGAVYGMGYGLTEEIVIEKGFIKTPSFSEYLLPTSMDVPEVQTIVLESGDGVGPFGAKGVGEPSLNSIAPAISNAVCDAIGVRIFELPLTPEKIVRALWKQKEKGGKDGKE